jgi:hypothetical protein
MNWNDRYKSPEAKEHISEMFYLLNFFALTQLEQWENIPDEFTPAWVEMNGSCHCNVRDPILFLSLALVGQIESVFSFNIFEEETKNVLFYELKTLLDWMNNSFFDFIFLKRPESELSDIDRIWLVVSRMCKIASNYENWDRYEIENLSFEHFVKKYAYPYDSSVD